MCLMLWRNWPNKDVIQLIFLKRVLTQTCSLKQNQTHIRSMEGGKYQGKRTHQIWFYRPCFQAFKAFSTSLIFTAICWPKYIFNFASLTLYVHVYMCIRQGHVLQKIDFSYALHPSISDTFADTFVVLFRSFIPNIW